MSNLELVLFLVKTLNKGPFHQELRQVLMKIKQQNNINTQKTLLVIIWILIGPLFAFQSTLRERKMHQLSQQLKLKIDVSISLMKARFESFDVKIHSDETYVYFSVKLKEDEEAKLKGGLELLMENGLRDMIKEQNNFFNFEFDANYNFDELVEAVDQGERIGAAFLKQIRAELNLFLTKNFYQGIEKFVAQTDKEALESPPLAFLKHFKMLDLDLRFRSTDELPEIIKNQMIFGEEFQTLKKEELQLPMNRTKQVNKIMDAAADNGFIYITLVDFACGKIESHTPKLSSLLMKYGKLLAKIVGLGEFVPDV